MHFFRILFPPVLLACLPSSLSFTVKEFRYIFLKKFRYRGVTMKNINRATNLEDVIGMFSLRSALFVSESNHTYT
jgi:hypothetical protein